MKNTQIIVTPYFKLNIGSKMKWIDLKRQNESAYRIRFYIDDQPLAINISVFLANEHSPKDLAKKQFKINQFSAFSRENIPLYELEKQQSGLETWGCRYRWVNGAQAPYKRNDLYMELGDYIVHFSYLAEPDIFDHGLIVLHDIARSLQPTINESK